MIFPKNKTPMKFVDKIKNKIVIIVKIFCTLICDLISNIPMQNLITIVGIIREIKLISTRIKSHKYLGLGC